MFFTNKKSATDIVNDEIAKYGVKEAMDIRSELNKTILDQTKRLREMPDNIREGLEAVGVTQGQLDRLVARETQKPAEILRDLLEQRGALSEDINASMSFVKLFADTELADQATNLEALKWQMEFKEGEMKDLNESKSLVLNAAIDERKLIMSAGLEALKNGAPQDIVNKTIQVMVYTTWLSAA